MKAAPAVAAALLLLSAPATAQWPAWFKKPSKAPVYPEILVSVSSLPAPLKAGLTVLDARPRAAFEKGHVPGAISLDPRTCDPNPADIAAHVNAAGLLPGARIVVYGDREFPESSGRLFWYLELLGRNVQVLNGGWEAWIAAGRPAERGASVRAAAAPEARPGGAPADTSRLADYAYVMRMFGRSGHTVMDWREPGEWAAAHIPHSLPFRMESLLNSDGTIMDGPSMRPYWEEFGPRLRDYVDLEDEFIVCGDTPADLAVHPYLAARIAGLSHVRCYPGGFSDWKTHANAPIVRIIDGKEVRDLIATGWTHRLPTAPSARALLIDLRAEGDFKLGHLPGAVWLPIDGFGDALESEASRRFPAADRRSLPVIFYCYGPGCVRSRNGSTIAAQHGFLNLLWFRDGTLGWQQLGEKLK